MKNVFITILFISFNIFSKESIKAKTYTQSEYDKKLELEVAKRVEKFRPTNLVELSKELLKKDLLIKQKEESLINKTQQIEIAENELNKKIEEFRIEQKKILGCISNQDKLKNSRVNHIVSSMSNMKPVKAAELLSVQDPKIAIEILGKLKPTKVAKIFNSMDKEISARLQKQYLSMKQ